MTAQTRTSNVSRSRPRHAMSAGQALIVVQERHTSKVNAVIAAGIVAQLQQRAMQVTIRRPTNKSVKLVDPDGTVFEAGCQYYQQLGIAAPTILVYEQPLDNGKWVQGFDGKTPFFQRMTTDGWKPGKIGLAYFKYNRRSVRIEHPVGMARPIGERTHRGQPPRFQFVHEVASGYKQTKKKAANVSLSGSSSLI